MKFFHRLGVEFIDENGGPGVRLRKSPRVITMMGRTPCLSGSG